MPWAWHSSGPACFILLLKLQHCVINLSLSLFLSHTRKTSSCPNSTSTENLRFMIHHWKFSISKWQEEHSVYPTIYSDYPGHPLAHPGHPDYQTNLMTILTILRIPVITIVIGEGFKKKVKLGLLAERSCPVISADHLIKFWVPKKARLVLNCSVDF